MTLEEKGYLLKILSEVYSRLTYESDLQLLVAEKIKNVLNTL